MAFSAAGSNRRIYDRREYSELKYQFVSQALVVQQACFNNADMLENLLKAEIDGLAFVLRRKTNPYQTLCGV